MEYDNEVASEAGWEADPADTERDVCGGWGRGGAAVLRLLSLEKLTGAFLYPYCCFLPSVSLLLHAGTG